MIQLARWVPSLLLLGLPLAASASSTTQASEPIPQDKVGLVALPGGRECYQPAIRNHTSLDMTPEEIHALGKSEIARIRTELSALGQKVLGTSDLAEIQRRLRNDPAMQFKTAEEIEAKAREALIRAQVALPRV